MRDYRQQETARWPFASLFALHQLGGLGRGARVRVLEPNAETSFEPLDTAAFFTVSVHREESRDLLLLHCTMAHKYMFI